MVHEMIDKNKDAHKQSLSELQQEIKSLKTILLGRGGGALASTPSTPLPGLAGRPSIPAWQLTGTSPASLSESSSATGSRTTTFGSSVQPNGKGKDVEVIGDHAS